MVSCMLSVDTTVLWFVRVSNVTCRRLESGEHRPICTLVDEMPVILLLLPSYSLQGGPRQLSRDHRRTSQGGWGAAAPQTRAKPLFFGQKPSAKMENVFLYLLNEKTEFILLNEIKCPKSRIFTNNYWVGESGKVTLQVSIAVFRALSKNFSGKDGSAPLEKFGPYAYARDHCK